jgi:hypothetical protein
MLFDAFDRVGRERTFIGPGAGGEIDELPKPVGKENRPLSDSWQASTGQSTGWDVPPLDPVVDYADAPLG